MAKHRSKISSSTRRAVYVRDEWTCQYCGHQFLPTTDGKAPIEDLFNESTGRWDYVFLELDHVHPVAHGGDNSTDNLRSACSLCNRRKAAFLQASDWDRRFELAEQVLLKSEPSERAAERVIEALLGRSFRMQEAQR